MDYKKKYETALPYIKDLIEHNVISIENAGKYFPELIDSDEKVRKAIVELVLQSSEILGSNNQSRMLAWLEKQGKRHTPIDIDKMVYKYGNTKEDCTDGLPVNCQIRAYKQGINDTLNLVFNLEKQGEQILDNSAKTCKDAWSEEDEEQVSIITNIVQAHCGKLIDCRANLKWLKSLKERML